MVLRAVWRKWDLETSAVVNFKREIKRKIYTVCREFWAFSLSEEIEFKSCGSDDEKENHECSYFFYISYKLTHPQTLRWTALCHFIVYNYSAQHVPWVSSRRLHVPTAAYVSLKGFHLILSSGTCAVKVINNRPFRPQSKLERTIEWYTVYLIIYSYSGLKNISRFQI